jgi:hypothetical protein
MRDPVTVRRPTAPNPLASLVRPFGLPLLPARCVSEDPAPDPVPPPHCIMDFDRLLITQPPFTQPPLFMLIRDPLSNPFQSRGGGHLGRQGDFGGAAASVKIGDASSRCSKATLTNSRGLFVRLVRERPDFDRCCGLAPKGPPTQALPAQMASDATP